MPDDNYYHEIFKRITVDQKRKDLEIHPFINHKEIKTATDEEVEQVYFMLFSGLDRAMRETVGESMYEDGYA